MKTFLFNLSDYIEHLQAKAENENLNLDKSLDSLNDLEAYIIKNNVSVDSDDYNDISAYLGEIVRSKFGGKWICNLDNENNSLYYGFPVIEGHALDGILFSPFHVVRAFILRKKEQLFLTAIKSQVYPKRLIGATFLQKISATG